MINTFLAITIFVFLSISPVNAESTLEDSYQSYLSDWDSNIALAKKYLYEAEKSLKIDDPLGSCSNQLKASNYGIKATKSRIEAYKISGQMGLVPELEEGLDKWKKLGQFCS